jgi:hypothetical protein
MYTSIYEEEESTLEYLCKMLENIERSRHISTIVTTLF